MFISLPVEPSVAKDIMARFLNLDLPWDSIKPSAPETLHINLKFIGDYPVDKIPYIIELLDNTKGSQDFIELSLDRPLIINEKHPRVLTLGCQPSEVLTKLHADIEQTLYENEIISKDTRRYTPHITLGRIKKVVKFDDLKSFSHMPVNWQISSTYFQLQESQLEKKGPTHYTLQTFNL